MICLLKKHRDKKFLTVIQGKVDKSLELLLAKIRVQLTQGVEKRNLVIVKKT